MKNGWISKLRSGAVFLGLLGLLGTPAVTVAQTAPAKTTAPPANAKTKAATKAAPSTADIADAKSKGLVWVNLNTRVYHKSEDATYGTTKNGKFMSEDDAKKAGYRQAQKGSAGRKRATPAAATATSK